MNSNYYSFVLGDFFGNFQERERRNKMAKKVEGLIKLQIPAGGATPAPPVGPALGQKGVNIIICF